MSDRGIGGFVRRALRSAGRQYAKSREEFTTGHKVSRLPRDEYGRVQIVCRRYVEQRAVNLNEAAVPECYDHENPDCRGCLEDIREGCIETW
ncbi:DUF7091 family protein [Haloarchaeobius sp. TZWWS8]|uniref:DUF7091 family protein n=1 Tax=Haloarchaeobius sp. TZWWS8 TaxID=3446121 RepID=UPI003EB78BB1